MHRQIDRSIDIDRNRQIDRSIDIDRNTQIKYLYTYLGARNAKIPSLVFCTLSLYQVKNCKHRMIFSDNYANCVRTSKKTKDSLSTPPPPSATETRSAYQVLRFIYYYNPGRPVLLCDARLRNQSLLQVFVLGQRKIYSSETCRSFGR